MQVSDPTWSPLQGGGRRFEPCSAHSAYSQVTVHMRSDCYEDEPAQNGGVSSPSDTTFHPVRRTSDALARSKCNERPPRAGRGGVRCSRSADRPEGRTLSS